MWLIVNLFVTLFRMVWDLGLGFHTDQKFPDFEYAVQGTAVMPT